MSVDHAENEKPNDCWYYGDCAGSVTVAHMQINLLHIFSVKTQRS